MTKDELSEMALSAADDIIGREPDKLRALRDKFCELIGDQERNNFGRFMLQAVETRFWRWMYWRVAVAIDFHMEQKAEQVARQAEPKQVESVPHIAV